VQNVGEALDGDHVLPDFRLFLAELCASS